MRSHDEQVGVQRLGVREDFLVDILSFAHGDVDAGECADLPLDKLLRACGEMRPITGVRRRRKPCGGEQDAFRPHRRDVQYGHPRVIQVCDRDGMIERVP